MYLIHKFQLWNIYVSIYKYLQITWKFKRYIILQCFQKGSWSGWKLDTYDFPENEYYRFCRFIWCYQRFILYNSWEVLKYVDRSDWLPAPPQQKLTDKTGNQNYKYGWDYKPCKLKKLGKEKYLKGIIWAKIMHSKESIYVAN